MKKRYKFGIIGLSVALVAALVFVLIPAGVTINQGGFLSIGTEVVLAVNAPPDIEMTEKSRSPGEITYYFDSVSTTIWTDYGFFVDNILTNYAYTNVDGETETLDGNTCPGTDLGVITKVEIRAYAYNSDGDDRIDLWVAGGFIGDEHQTTPASSPGWGTYQNITSDANAPSPWTWSDVVAVDVDVEFDKVGKGNVVLCSKVEIKVTYGEAPKGGSVVFVRATEGAITNTVLTLNIQVSAGTDRVLVVGLAYKSSSVVAPTSILFNTSESFVLEKTAIDGGDAQCFMYYLVAPTETTADVVITMPGSVRMVGYVAYFTGVDQNNPFTANTTEAQGTDAVPTVDLTSAADEIAIDIMAQVSGGPDTITSNTGTKICDGAATGGGSDTRGGGQYDTGAAPVTMGYTTSDADNWNIIAGALQEPPAIDIGAEPIDRAANISYAWTFVDKNNPANASGTLHSVKVYANTNITGLRVGTFYTTNGNTLKCRDSELIGDVEAGAERTFTELSITVVTGDYVGCYFAGGKLEFDIDGFDGVWRVSGEYIDPDDETTYIFYAGDAISVYGYGDIDGAVPDIVVSPDTWTLNGITGSGVIHPDTIYYANPQGDTQAPASTVADGDCRFTITNSSTMAIDLTCTMGSFTGGDADMTNSDDGSNGATTFGAYSWFSGQLYANKVVIKSTGSSVGYDGLPATTDIKWGAEVETRTNAWTGSSSSTATLTITATVD